MCGPRTAPARCCFGEDRVDAASVISKAQEMDVLQELAAVEVLRSSFRGGVAPILVATEVGRGRRRFRRQPCPRVTLRVYFSPLKLAATTGSRALETCWRPGEWVAEGHSEAGRQPAAGEGFSFLPPYQLSTLPLYAGPESRPSDFLMKFAELRGA